MFYKRDSTPSFRPRFFLPTACPPILALYLSTPHTLLPTPHHTNPYHTTPYHTTPIHTNPLHTIPRHLFGSGIPRTHTTPKPEHRPGYSAIFQADVTALLYTHAWCCRPDPDSELCLQVRHSPIHPPTNSRFWERAWPGRQLGLLVHIRISSCRPRYLPEAFTNYQISNFVAIATCSWKVMEDSPRGTESHDFSHNHPDQKPKMSMLAMATPTPHAPFRREYWDEARPTEYGPSRPRSDAERVALPSIRQVI